MQILMIDDDHLDVELVRRVLNSLGEPVELLNAYDGRQALEMLKDTESPLVNKPLALLVDINMPRMNGHEFLREIREESQFDGLPIFVFSGSERSRDIEECQAHNISGYVYKPLGLENMRKALNTIVQFLNLIRVPSHRPAGMIG